MTKKLICECGANCGEMEKGRFRKGSIILCPKCVTAYQALKMMAEARRSGGQNPDWDTLFGDHKGQMGDFFKDMFKKR